MRIWRDWSPHTLLAENRKRCSHSGKQSGSASKIKPRITTWPIDSTPRHVSKWDKNTCPHKNLCVNALTWNELSDISPANGFTWDRQRIALQDLKPRWVVSQSPQSKGRRMRLQREKDVMRVIVKKSLWFFIGWVLAGKEASSFLFGSAIIAGYESAPLWSPDSNWGFCLVFFTNAYTNSFLNSQKK